MQESMGAPDARAMLKETQEAGAAGVRRAVPSRAYVACCAIWAGLVAGTVATVVWLPLFFAGLLAHVVYRSKRGAWMQEVGSAREFYGVVLPLGLLLGAAIVAGYYCTTRLGLWQVPVAAGVVVAIVVFALSELGLRRVRRSTSKSGPVA